MSYILEALRKMERQRRKDDKAEAWVNELTAESEEKKTFFKNPSRILVAASIVFGASGILAGLIFYHDNTSTGIERGRIYPSPVITESGKRPHSDGPRNAKPSQPAEDNESPPDPASTSLKGTTISQIKTAMPSPPLQVKKQKSVDIIDLTDRYRLTSTGEVNERKYASIDRRDYFIGDVFNEMRITDIKKDRVYLMGEKGEQRYVIVFRYRE